MYEIVTVYEYTWENSPEKSEILFHSQEEALQILKKHPCAIILEREFEVFPFYGENGKQVRILIAERVLKA